MSTESTRRNFLGASGAAVTAAWSGAGPSDTINLALIGCGERVAAYQDYRRLLEDKNVDAVIVATNQHWHVLPMIAACQAGKDVYLEKPLGNSIGEGPVAIEAGRKYSRIVQAGTLPQAGTSPSKTTTNGPTPSAEA